MLDLIPFAGVRRQVMNSDVDAKFVGLTSQLAFPEPHARAIAAATVGCDSQVCGVGISLDAKAAPSTTDPRLETVVHPHPTQVVCLTLIIQTVDAEGWLKSVSSLGGDGCGVWLDVQ